ncbi:T9SS type A sorting domain-containing protein [Flavobacterium pallidum]|uniref:Ig-like domain-containing protein n=1 Tax=Flavobacterium pallidum TaxID=2172098 RepID=A0A2S1SIK6_9FLAO|nr:T9SS type A sorting domain-containing protein [Flavobacterium pallidum]AWI26221.1 hypothetical protein HYN49_10090 [Flavobacterium pallidum]
MKKTLLFFTLLSMGVAFAQGTHAIKLSGAPVPGTNSSVVATQSGHVSLQRATNAVSLLQPKKSEYTRVPLGQAPQSVYSAMVFNGNPDPVTAQVRLRIFNGAMNELATAVSAPEVVAANATSAELFVAPVFNPTVQGTYTFTYDKIIDGTPDSSDSVSYPVDFTGTLMARDDDNPAGALGIGAGNGGYLGQTFTFSEAATLSSVSIFHMGNNTGNGDSVEMACAVFKMVAGVPQLVYTAPSQQIADGAQANMLYYAVNPPMAIEAGDTLLLCAQEFGQTISVGLTPTIFTEGATYVNWPTSPFGGWAHNEDFGGGFNKAYMIRANLVCTLPDPAVAAAQEFCAGATVNNLNATGVGIEWFADAAGGTALAGNTALTTDTYYVSQHDGPCYSDRIPVAVTVNAVTSNTTTVVSCDNYTWAENGMTYTDSGVYNVVTGCHTEILDLTLTPSTINTTQVNACGSYTWSVNDVTYTGSGFYNVVTGCHTEILELTITPATSNTTVIDACDNYTWAENGVTYTDSGVYNVVTDCHTEILELTITPYTSNTTSVNACETYTWAENGVTYTDAGVYQAVSGCHTETLELTFTGVTSNTTAVEACDSYTWAENGITYTDSGIYEVVTGCHTEVLELTITPATSNITAISACDSYTWDQNNVTYTESGMYEVVTGCHTEMLELTITPTTVNTSVVSVCDAYTWDVNGVTYTETGNYDITNGCHTEILDLTITAGPFITVQPVSTEVAEGSTVFFSVAAENVGTYQWQGSADNGLSWLDIPEGSGFTGTNGATLEINGALITMDANGVLFRCVITNGNCNAISNEATLSVVLGIDPIGSNSVMLYPNPTHDRVQVATKAAAATVTVFDINGRLIYTQQLVNGSGDIDLTNVQAGVYLFRVATEKGTINKKVVKQ